MHPTLSAISSLNYTYECLKGPRRVSPRAKRLAESIAHGAGLEERLTSDEYLHFVGPDGQEYIFGQVNRGAGFTSL